MLAAIDLDHKHLLPAYEIGDTRANRDLSAELVTAEAPVSKSKTIALFPRREPGGRVAASACSLCR
jgi:hypothetical protein